MAETTEAWLIRQLREVDEDGRRCVSILLQVGDAMRVLDSWHAPLREAEGGPGPKVLAETIEEVIAAAAEEWPAKKRHQVQLIAIDNNGAERGSKLISVTGKSQTATGAHLASESVAHAGAMQMHVATMKTLMDACNSQVYTQQKTIEMLQANLLATQELMINSKMKMVLEAEEAAPRVQAEIWGGIKEMAPQIFQLVEGYLAAKK
jgi:hypothetical protein